MALTATDILFEDKHIIVCYKPAGIATQTANLGSQDMVSLVRNYLKAPYIGIIHRLDQPVEGVLIFAKTKEAAASLSRQNMDKRYYAVVLLKESDADKRNVDADQAEYTLTDYLVKNGKDNTSSIADKNAKDAKKAELTYRLIRGQEETEGEGKTFLPAEICLKTGRHHQIRVQMAHAGMPLLGDMKYGSKESMSFSLQRNVKNIALCAYSLTFLHPETKKKMNFSIIPRNPVFQPFFPINPSHKNQ